jgi:hypothetical protein
MANKIKTEKEREEWKKNNFVLDMRLQNQRHRLQLIRIIGSSGDSTLLLQRIDDVYSIVEYFESHADPDYLQLKEVLFMFSSLIKQKARILRENYMLSSSLINTKKQQQQKKPPLLDEKDQYIMNRLVKIIQDRLGTQDSAWFSVAETYLNIIFELKSKTAP